MSVSGYGEGSDVALIDAAALHRLIEVLIGLGYRVVGPTLRDNAIVLDELSSAADLPRGWGVEVAAGHYRVRRRDDDAVTYLVDVGTQQGAEVLASIPHRAAGSGDRLRAGRGGGGASDAPPDARHRPARSADQVPRIAAVVVSDNLALGDAALTDLCERLIRSYDPRISCSAHFLRLRVRRG